MVTDDIARPPQGTRQGVLLYQLRRLDKVRQPCHISHFSFIQHRMSHRQSHIRIRSRQHRHCQFGRHYRQTVWALVLLVMQSCGATLLFLKSCY